MAGAPRVVIAHDDELIRDMLGLACARRGVDVVDQVDTYDDLLGACAGEAADVTVVADRLDGTPVEYVLDELLATDVRAIVLSADPSPDRLVQLLARDVYGYLSHDVGLDEVVSGILVVAGGQVALNAPVLSTIVHLWRRLRAQPVEFGVRRRLVLTPRELEILAAMTDGLAGKAIAARLGMALKTVENHKIRIFEKLGVRSNAHAVTVAMAYGLVDAPAAPRRSSEIEEAGVPEPR
jgi:DNA-binding NarL/FixJ family response regulator